MVLVRRMDVSILGVRTQVSSLVSPCFVNNRFHNVAVAKVGCKGKKRLSLLEFNIRQMHRYKNRCPKGFKSDVVPFSK